MSTTLTNDSASGGYIIDVPPPPPTGDQITQALQITVAQLTQIPGTLVRPRWQPTPPARPSAETTWASVGITRVEADDYPAIVHDGSVTLPGAAGPGVDRMQRHSTVTVLATFYGPEAETAAGAFRDALYIQQNYEPLIPFGLKLREVRDLARSPELINQQWIDRFDVEIELRRQINRVYPVLNLDGVDVNLTTDEPPATTPVSVREDPVIIP